MIKSIEMNRDKKLYKLEKVLWEVDYIVGDSARVNGPYCATEECKYELDLTHDENDNLLATCPECNKKIEFKCDLTTLKDYIGKRIMASMRSQHQVVSLDLPPTNVNVKEEDDNYWIRARIGQKNGKKFAIIYFGEQTKKQSPKDKVQFFIDLEDEELRHDSSNMPPGDIITGVKIKFKNSISERGYRTKS